MDEKDILREAHLIEKELEGRPPTEKTDRAPLVAIGAIALAFIIILMSVPYYGIKSDPNPSMIPGIDEVVPPGTIAELPNAEYRELADMIDVTPFVKQVSTRIATLGCDSSDICQAKAQYIFVRDRFTYVSEQDEYLQTPEEMFFTKGGDCDDHAILLANLLQGIGMHTRFVVLPNHVYVEAWVPDAPKRYKNSLGWIALDPTCKSCEFGEIKIQSPIKRYI